jgi:cytochrome P450
MLSLARGIQKDPLSFLINMAQRYGDFVAVPVGSLPVFLVNHPEGVKNVLQDHHRRYSKDTIQYNALSTITGRGLLTNDGSSWLRQRRLTQPAFSRPRLMALDQIVVPAAQRMLDRWEGIARYAGTVDVDSEMMRLTLEIVGKMLFSIDLSEEAGPLTQAVLTALDHIMYRARNVLVFPDFVPTPRNLRFRRAVQTLNHVVDAMVSERQKNDLPGDDLLGMLLRSRDEETGQGMTNAQIRDEILTMLIAGHETVASALTWTWYLLSSHPKERDRLHQEAVRQSDDHLLTTADLPLLPYSAQVFSEALRLYPPAWVISRKAVEADELQGVSIPAGALVIISPYVIHRHPDFWETPLAFEPDRFSVENVEKIERFAYIPFGAGPRLCIGSHFATIEAQLIMTMIARRFWLEEVPEKAVQVDALVTLRPAHGLTMRIHCY